MLLAPQAVWHCALPNTSDAPRRNVIMGVSGEGASPAVGSPLQVAVEENVADGLMEPEQRDSFGL